MKMSRALTKVLLYIGKKGPEMKRYLAAREKTAVVLPMSSPRRVGLLAGIGTKSQSPRCSPSGWGTVVTNDRCIKVYYVCCRGQHEKDKPMFWSKNVGDRGLGLP